MTVNYTFRFIDTDTQYSETATAPFDVDTSICDFIEEQVYILWELRPVERYWQRQFATTGYAKFSFHGHELFIISYDWDNSKKILVEKVRN